MADLSLPLVRSFQDSDTENVVALWQACGLTRPWNDPYKDIARKKQVQPELFLVVIRADRLVASVMIGYDGHRGWANYLAVEPSEQGRGLGRLLMQEAETRLTALGCPKLSLLVRSGNAQVVGFYKALGYGVDEVVALGKRLIPDSF